MGGWTKGPWRFEAFRDKDHSYARNSVPGGVIRDDEHREIACVDAVDLTESEWLPTAHLIAAAPDLYEALATIVDRYKRDGEGAVEHYDRLAAEFHRDTGRVAPGKDISPADPQDREANREAWAEWHAAVHESARAALAKARGEQ